MNLPVLACLLFSLLSVALSFTALVVVLRRPRPATTTEHIIRPYVTLANAALVSNDLPDEFRPAARYPLPAAVTTRTATAPTTGRRAARKDPS